MATGREWAREKNKNKGRALIEGWPDYADGRILSGKEAFDKGFVDELGTFEDAVKRAKYIAGIRNANLIEYQQRFDISDLFRLFGQTRRQVRQSGFGHGSAQAPGRPALFPVADVSALTSERGYRHFAPPGAA